MNRFFDKTVADDIAKYEEFMNLINQINEDPSILNTLSLEMLVQVNAYFEEKCRKVEEEIRMLEQNLASLKAELQEEGDTA